MKYFFINLAVHIVVTVLLIAMVVLFANRNRRGKTGHTLTYFMPVLFLIITLAYATVYTVPRLRDVTSVIDDKYYSYSGVISEVSTTNNYVVVDGKTFYINPIRDIPEKGTYVRVRYAQYSNYAIEVSVAEEVNVDSLASE